jgi:hypothetical protein
VKKKRRRRRRRRRRKVVGDEPLTILSSPHFPFSASLGTLGRTAANL